MIHLGNKIWTLSIVGVTCLFIHCTENKIASGTVETTNGIARLSSGQPAANANVFILADEAWLGRYLAGQSVVLDSFKTDSEGHFSFPSELCKSCNIEISDLAEGVINFTYTAKSPTSNILDTFTLAPLKTYSVYLEKQNSLLPQYFLLGGTRYHAELTEVNIYSFKKIPPESYLLLSQSDYLYTHHWLTPQDFMANAVMDTIHTNIQNTLPLELFDTPDNRNQLGLLLGGGWWDVQSDAYQGGTSKIISPVNASPFEFAKAIDRDSLSRQGRLQMNYLLANPGTEKPYAFAYAELNLGKGHYNLSAMDSLTFIASGNGQLRVEFIQHSFAAKILVEASYTINLGSNMQNFSIGPKQLIVQSFWFPNDIASIYPALTTDHIPLYVKAPASWGEMGGMVKSIRFTAISGNQFSLENIVLHGVHLSDMVNYAK